MYILNGPCEETKPEDRSFGQVIFDSLKRKNQQDVALIDAHTGVSLTYGELLEQSIKTAHNFKLRGISKNDIIAVVSENNLTYIVPVLAALYLGAIIQPMNPTWTLEELRHSCEISKPKWVICSATALDTINRLVSKLGYIERVVLFGPKRDAVKSFDDFLNFVDQDTLANFEPERLDPKNQVAFVLSSSGTTGLPKGVMVTHRSFVLTIENWRDSRFGNYREGDTTLAPMPLFHLFGLNMILVSLMASTKYIMMDKFNPQLYLRCIQDYKVNKLCCPPPLIVFLAKSPLVGLYDLSTLEEIMSGASLLQPEIGQLVQRRLKVNLRETFATTETTGACTMVPWSCRKSGGSGVLLPHVSAKVRDPNTHDLLGPNQRGELCFKGPLIMKGYLNNPEQTAAAFDEEGFYLTGDVGYYDEDGFFFIVDRLKDIIKYKGYQIAPAEVEGLLLTHPAVKDVAVIGIPDERAGELSLAYVVKEPSQQVCEKDLVDFVAEHVYHAKRLYGGVRFIQEIPRNPGGKILRRFLRDMSTNGNL